MRYDDEHLADLLRALPPAPVHVVSAAKALFEHADVAPLDEPDHTDDSDDGGHDDPLADHPPPVDDHDAGFDHDVDDGDAGDDDNWS